MFQACLGLCLFLWSTPSSEKANRKKDSVQWKKKKKEEKKERKSRRASMAGWDVTLKVPCQ